MAKAKIEKQNDLCDKGCHKFIVTAWISQSMQQKANAFTCERCLLTVTGANEIQKIRENYCEANP